MGISGCNRTTDIAIDGTLMPRSHATPVSINHVASNYLETWRMSLLAGRTFQRSDTVKTKKVAIVNDAFVRRYFPGRDSIGQHIAFGQNVPSSEKVEIIGVVKDFKRADPEKPYLPTYYCPSISTPTAYVMWNFEHHGS